MTETAAPRKILIVSANPPETARLALDNEYRAIQQAQDRSRNRDMYVIRLSAAARIQDLQAELLEFRPQVVHFCGHGEKDALAFADGDNRGRWVEGDGIAHLFSLASGYVECVLLNACWSESLAGNICQHVGYAVGMERQIGDEAAIEFSRGFYTALFAGEFYTRAYEHGCAAIRLMSIPEHLTPRLKIRENAVRSQYVPGLQTDLCVMCAERHRAWLSDLMGRLDNLMAQHMGGRNAYQYEIVTEKTADAATPAAGAATLLVIHSERIEASDAFHDGLGAFLSRTRDEKRVFLVESDALPRPDALQKVPQLPVLAPR